MSLFLCLFASCCLLFVCLLLFVYCLLFVVVYLRLYSIHFLDMLMHSRGQLLHTSSSISSRASSKISSYRVRPTGVLLYSIHFFTSALEKHKRTPKTARARRAVDFCETILLIGGFKSLVDMLEKYSNFSGRADVNE